MSPSEPSVKTAYFITVTTSAAERWQKSRQTRTRITRFSPHPRPDIWSLFAGGSLAERCLPAAAALRWYENYSVRVQRSAADPGETEAALR